MAEDLAFILREREQYRIHRLQRMSNMTAEQLSSHREQQRNRQARRRQRMTDAQRAAEREKQRIRRQNMTDAQKSAERERQRVSYRVHTAQATPFNSAEQDLASNQTADAQRATERKRQRNMSDAQRSAERERHRIRRRNMSDAQRSAEKERHRKRRQNMSDAQRSAEKERQRIRYRERTMQASAQQDSTPSDTRNSSGISNRDDILSDIEHHAQSEVLRLTGQGDHVNLSTSGGSIHVSVGDGHGDPDFQDKDRVLRDEDYDGDDIDVQRDANNASSDVDQIRTPIDQQERLHEKHLELEASEVPTDQISTLIDRQERLHEKNSELEAFSEGCKAYEAPKDGNVSIVAEDWSGTFKRDTQADDIRFDIIGISSYQANQRQNEEFSLTAYSTNAFVAVGPLGKQVLEGEKPITLEICTGEQTTGDSPKSVKRTLEMKLDELRKELASSHGGIVPHAVLSTQQISILCANRPTSITELEELIGKVNSDKYGSRIIDLLEQDIGGGEHSSKVKDAENGANKWRRKEAGAEEGGTISAKKMVVSRKRRVSVDIAGGGAAQQKSGNKTGRPADVTVQDKQPAEQGMVKQPMVEMQSSKWKSVFSTIRTMTRVADHEKTTQLEGEGGS